MAGQHSDFTIRMALFVSCVLPLILTYFTQAVHTKLAPRIIGGKEARGQEYNFTGFIRGTTDKMNYYRYCSCILVGPDVVITTADCTQMNDTDLSLAHTNISFGTGQEFANSREHIFSIRSMKRSPRYNAFEGYNNIAVLRLNSSVPKTVATPIKIFTDKEFPGLDTVTTGFGVVSPSDDKSYPFKIMQINMQVSSLSLCRGAFRVMYDDQFCTKNQDGSGICYGDSGGPVIVQTDSGSLGLLGMSSGLAISPGNPTATCGSDGGANLHIRVSYYTGFIADEGSLNEDDITISNKTVVDPNSDGGDPSSNDSPTDDHDSSSDSSGQDDQTEASSLFSSSDSPEKGDVSGANLTFSSLISVAMIAVLVFIV